MTPFRILAIGDIVGRPGRVILEEHLADLQDELQVDFTIANIENAASGFGTTDAIYKELLSYGVDVFTSGNHIYSKKEFVDKFSQYEDLVRPLNFAPGSPGEGIRYYSVEGTKIAVVNLIGRVFMNPSDCPFQSIQRQLADIAQKATIIVVDFHAEATSEKVAMGWYLDGKVTAVFGTHTHIQTADDRLLEKGTAYITDLGMTGARDSILGMEKEPIIGKFFDQMPTRFEPAQSDIGIICGVLITADKQTGKALNIERVQKSFRFRSKVRG